MHTHGPFSADSSHYQLPIIVHYIKIEQYTQAPLVEETHESSFQRRYLLPYPRWPGHTQVQSVRRTDDFQLSCSEDRCKQHNNTFRK
jgi:hypothetical protein